MTEDWKLFVALAVIVAVVFLISRYPAVLTALLGRATARCRDGTLSFSAHSRGTCSHHGGVVKWLGA